MAQQVPRAFRQPQRSLARMLEDEQQRLIHASLDILSSKGFVLAGSGAIREHGLIARPTEDVDLFCSIENETSFSSAVDSLIAHLNFLGYSVSVSRRTDHFASIIATLDKIPLSIDLGIDYRAYPPTQLSIGAVLDIKDAVANKVCALFSRGEARDYLDVDAIRNSKLFADAELIDLASENDSGFTADLFAESLSMAEGIQPVQVERYGISALELSAIKSRLLSWRNIIIDKASDNAKPLIFEPPTRIFQQAHSPAADDKTAKKSVDALSHTQEKCRSKDNPLR